MVLAAVVGGHSLLVAEAAAVRHHVLRRLVVLRSTLFVLYCIHAVCKRGPKALSDARKLHRGMVALFWRVVVVLCPGGR